jgi:hypothetical protein
VYLPLALCSLRLKNNHENMPKYKMIKGQYHCSCPPTHDIDSQYSRNQVRRTPNPKCRGFGAPAQLTATVHIPPKDAFWVHSMKREEAHTLCFITNKPTKCTNYITYINLFYSSDMLRYTHYHQGGTHHIIIPSNKLIKRDTVTDSKNLVFHLVILGFLN